MYPLAQVVLILLLILLVYIARETYRELRGIKATLEEIRDRIDMLD